MKVYQRSKIATGLLALALLAGQVAAQPEDFAYGMTLAVDGSSALYRALLPFECTAKHNRRISPTYGCSTVVVKRCHIRFSR